MRRLCPCQGSLRVELVSGARVFDRVTETTQRDKLRIAGVGGRGDLFLEMRAAKRARGEEGIAGATRFLRVHTCAHIDWSSLVLAHQRLVRSEQRRVFPTYSPTVTANKRSQ